MRRRPARSSGIPSRGRVTTWAGCAPSRTGTSARSSARCPEWPTCPASAGFRSSTRSSPTPTGMQVMGVSLGDVSEAVATSNAASGGHVVHKGNAEYVVRGVGGLGASPTAGDESVRPGPGRLATSKTWSCRGPPGARSGSPRSRTSRSAPAFAEGCWRKTATRSPAAWSSWLTAKTRSRSRAESRPRSASCSTGLPRGVRIVPFYDRTPLIQGAIGTVTSTVVEAMISASLCVLVVLLACPDIARHRRTLPLAALTSFLIMACCGGWASSTSRPTPCRWPASRSRSACWSIRRS